jgi:hypothetical protein
MTPRSILQLLLTAPCGSGLVSMEIVMTRRFVGTPSRVRTRSGRSSSTSDTTRVWMRNFSSFSLFSRTPCVSNRASATVRAILLNALQTYWSNPLFRPFALGVLCIPPSCFVFRLFCLNECFLKRRFNDNSRPSQSTSCTLPSFNTHSAQQPKT